MEANIDFITACIRGDESTTSMYTDDVIESINYEAGVLYALQFGYVSIFKQIYPLIDENKMNKETLNNPTVFLDLDETLYNNTKLQHGVKMEETVKRYYTPPGMTPRELFIKYVEKELEDTDIVIDNHGYFGLKMDSITLSSVEKNDVEIFENCLSGCFLFGCKHGRTELVKGMIKQGADIHHKNDLGIKLALEGGHIDVVEYLILDIKPDAILEYTDSKRDGNVPYEGFNYIFEELGRRGVL